MKEVDSVLGAIDFGKEEIPAHIKKLVAKREEARKSKDWKKADMLREEIKKERYEIMDSPEGARVKKS